MRSIAIRSTITLPVNQKECFRVRTSERAKRSSLGPPRMRRWRHDEVMEEPPKTRQETIIYRYRKDKRKWRGDKPPLGGLAPRSFLLAPTQPAVWITILGQMEFIPFGPHSSCVRPKAGKELKPTDDPSVRRSLAEGEEGWRSSQTLKDIQIIKGGPGTVGSWWGSGGEAPSTLAKPTFLFAKQISSEERIFPRNEEIWAMRAVKIIKSNEF